MTKQKIKFQHINIYTEKKIYIYKLHIRIYVEREGGKMRFLKILILERKLNILILCLKYVL